MHKVCHFSVKCHLSLQEKAIGFLHCSTSTWTKITSWFSSFSYLHSNKFLKLSSCLLSLLFVPVACILLLRPRRILIFLLIIHFLVIPRHFLFGKLLKRRNFRALQQWQVFSSSNLSKLHQYYLFQSSTFSFETHFPYEMFARQQW